MQHQFSICNKNNELHNFLKEGSDSHELPNLGHKTLLSNVAISWI